MDVFVWPNCDAGTAVDYWWSSASVTLLMVQEDCAEGSKIPVMPLKNAFGTLFRVHASL